MNKDLYTKVNEICLYMVKNYTLESSVSQCYDRISAKRNQNTKYQNSFVAKPQKPVLYSSTQHNKPKPSFIVSFLGVALIAIVLTAVPYLMFLIRDVSISTRFNLLNLLIGLILLLIPTASKVALIILFRESFEDIIAYRKNIFILLLYPILLVIQLLSEIPFYLYGIEINSLFLKIATIIIFVIHAVAIIVCLFSLIDKIRKENSDLKSKREYNKTQTDYYNRQLKQYEKEVANLSDLKKQRNRETTFYCDVMNAQINKINSVLPTLKNKILTLQNAANVPYDYRDMDCMLMIEQILRNDLADTLREAILIYEDRIAKQLIIKGMANIERKIDNLTATINRNMQAVTAVINKSRNDIVYMLQRLEENTRSIENNTETIADNTESMKQELVNQSMLTKYATTEVRVEIY